MKIKKEYFCELEKVNLYFVITVVKTVARSWATLLCMVEDSIWELEEPCKRASTEKTGRQLPFWTYTISWRGNEGLKTSFVDFVTEKCLRDGHICLHRPGRRPSVECLLHGCLGLVHRVSAVFWQDRRSDRHMHARLDTLLRGRVEQHPVKWLQALLLLYGHWPQSMSVCVGGGMCVWYV